MKRLLIGFWVNIRKDELSQYGFNFLQYVFIFPMGFIPLHHFKSIKNGEWREYDNEGNIVSVESYNLDVNDSKY